MSVYKPKKSKVYHYDYVWQGQRHHGSTGCAAKRDAERFEGNHRRKVALGEQAKPTITLEDACNTWQEMVGDHRKNRATSLYQLGYLIAGIGATRPLHDLNFKEIQDYTAKRRAMVSETSVNREIELLRAVVRWTKPRGYEVPEIEWGKLMFREPQERVRELSADEQERLFDALHDNLKPLVEFALLSGKRRSEITTLRWSDVDLVGKRATVTIKGGDRHKFPLSPRMLEIIKAQPPRSARRCLPTSASATHRSGRTGLRGWQANATRSRNKAGCASGGPRLSWPGSRTIGSTITATPQRHETCARPAISRPCRSC